MALVAMFAVSTTADAQFGGLLKAAKKAAGGKSKEAKAAEAHNEAYKLAIPQAKQGEVVNFSLESTIGVETKNEAVAATWNPATLEVTINTDRNGNKPGTVVKLDPKTGKFTDASGKAMGSISADGTIESLGLGTIKLNEVKTTLIQQRDVEMIVGYNIKRVSDNYKLMNYCCYNNKDLMPWSDAEMGKIKWGVNKGAVSDPTVNSLIVAYVYFGLIFNQDDILINKLGYDINKTFTEAQLRDMIQYKDEAVNAQIRKIEEGFLDYNSFTKGGKIAEIGLISRWQNFRNYLNRGKWNEVEYTVSLLTYWVVYEMPDGKNKVAFYDIKKNENNNGITKRDKCKGMHMLTDWQRK